ncbi:MAG: EamA family transporter [Bacillota bacterium]
MLLISMVSWSVFSVLGKRAMRRLLPLETITYAVVVGTALFAAYAWKDIAAMPWHLPSMKSWLAIFTSLYLEPIIFVF